MNKIQTISNEFERKSVYVPGTDFLLIYETNILKCQRPV